MEKHPQVLRLDPSSEIVFNGNNGAYGKVAFSEVVTTTLRLDNPSDKIVYFKVKTTAPKNYCVRPNSGVIKPGLSAEISVLLQPVDDAAILEREGAKHKFMIQSAYASTDLTPVDEFWKAVNTADVMDSKLRVVFNTSSPGNANPPSSAPVTAAPSKRSPTPTDSSAKQSKQDLVEDKSKDGMELRRRYEAEKQRLESENRKLQDQVKLALSQQQSTALAGHENGVPMIQVALAAFAMLLIGLILGKMF